MFNRVKNAIVNAVAGDTIDNNGSINTTNQSRIKYERPAFLGIDESSISNVVDHKLRPIIVNKNFATMPFHSGYGECVNAGKSTLNEDQASYYTRNLQRENSENRGYEIPYTYFGLFDGHAGFGSAVAAARQLHHIVHEKLVDIMDELLMDDTMLSSNVTKNALIVGVLEQAFKEMDELIAKNLTIYEPAGGCTALVILMILGKIFIANAGDSRAVMFLNSAGIVKSLSSDHTPETEKKRIRFLAAQQPKLLGAEFTCKEYLERPLQRNLGRRILFRDPMMTGWGSKILSVEDLKYPIINGEGKRSRVMGTIGVTRGFGDHTLTGMGTKVLIKPFLSSHPDVQIVKLNELVTSSDDVVVLGTDGLWDVTSIIQADRVIRKTFQQFPTALHRYNSAAQALVAHARGKLIERSWRLTTNLKHASVDDISVFVIPLDQYNRATNLKLNLSADEAYNATLSSHVSTCSNLSPGVYVSDDGLDMTGDS